MFVNQMKANFKFLDTTTPGPWLLYRELDGHKFYVMVDTPVGLSTVCIVEREQDAQTIITLRNSAKVHELMYLLHEESNKYMVDKMDINTKEDFTTILIISTIINLTTLFYGYPWYLFFIQVLFSLCLTNWILSRKAVKYFKHMSNFVSNFKQ